MKSQEKAKKALDEDQCEIKWVQAYMDEDCDQQYLNPQVTDAILKQVDTANRVALYA